MNIKEILQHRHGPGPHIERAPPFLAHRQEAMFRYCNVSHVRK